MHAVLAANPDRRRWLVLAVTVAAQFMVVVDIAVVNVALPPIGLASGARALLAAP
jgi:hypothetical protein